MDIGGYSNTPYTFPSDGYVSLNCFYQAGHWIRGDFLDKNSKTMFTAQVSSVNSGYLIGRTSQTIFVKKGMKVLIGRVDGNDIATYVPLQ